MKTLITAALCIALAQSGAPQTNTPTQPAPNRAEPDGALACYWLGCLVLTCAAAGTIAIIYCHWKAGRNAPQHGQVCTFVLKRTYNMRDWQIVATNAVVYDTNMPQLEIFRQEIERDRTGAICFKAACIGVSE